MVIGLIEVVGAGLVRALVAIRAGLIIGAAAFLEMAIAAANESKAVPEPLKTFFAIVAMVMGSGALLTVLMFLIEQGRKIFGKQPP